LAGLVVALLVVLPFRSVPFTRLDGVVVKLPAPDRLNHTSDTWDYLQIAREIYRSHRYESLFTYVPFLPDWHPGLTTWPPEEFPVLWRQPGYPLLIAGAFAVCGRPDPDVLLWLQAAAIVVLPLATYLLGLACLRPGWACCAGFWALLAPLAVSPASPFVATTWFAGIVALLAAALVRSTRIGVVAVAGVLLGIAVAFRFETWMLLPGLLLMFWLGGYMRRGVATIVLLAIAIAVVIPWYRLRAQCAGETFTLSSLLYHDTHAFPGWTSSRTLAVRDLTPLGFLRAHPGDVLAKTGFNLLRYGRDLALAPSPFLAPLVWIAMLRRPGTARPRALLLGTALATLGLVLALAPLEYSPRFLGPLVPLFAVSASWAMSRLPRYRRGLAVTATAIGLVVTIVALSDRTHQGTARVAAEDLNRLMTQPEAQEVRGGGGLLLCDAPTLYAWIWEGLAVWTPLPDDIPKVLRELNAPRILALFTRAGGHGDGLARNTVEEYVNRGGIASGRQPPLTVTFTWSPTTP
jgi:hypothetical protein